MPAARLYDDNLYRFDTPQQSYWEATGGEAQFDALPVSIDDSCDVAIIGGGYTGLSAALHLAREHDIDVRVLEAGHIGWGASGRNGGFCCIGGTGRHRGSLIRQVGLENARRFYQASADAVGLVRELADAEGIDLQAAGDAEIEVAHTPKAAAELQSDHDVMTSALGLDAELLSAAESRELLFESSESHGALISRPAFGLHPLRYCRGLAAAAVKHGAVLHAHSEVIDWHKRDGSHQLTTAGGTLRAKRVIHACNGFVQEDLSTAFYGRALPIISAIVVTRPLTQTELEAQRWQTRDPAINSRLMLNYFRLLPDRRFLFGGRGHTAGHAAGEAETYANNIATLRRIWPGWRDVDIEFRWHGLICFTATLRPSLGRLEDDPSVFFAYGYHGNGVNMATWSGKYLARWIADDRCPREIPDILTGLSRRFPLPKLRARLFRVGVSIAKWRDGR